MFEFIYLAVLIGAGGTALLDLWARVLDYFFDQPLPPWHLVGRWFAGMPKGHFVHYRGIGQSPEVANELRIGWAMHYAVGILFAAALLAIWGTEWAHRPSFGPALTVGLVTVLAGWYLLQPGMGVGVACNTAPNPTVARLHNIVGHVVFAIGMYWTALIVG